MPNSAKGAFLIAFVFTWMCFSIIVFSFSGGITGSVVGIKYDVMSSDFELGDYQKVLVNPRGPHASKIIRTMEGVDVIQEFDESFTANVKTELLPKIKTMADVYYLR